MIVGWIAFALFALTVPLANWLIGNVGTACVPDGPCLIPVDFGLLGLMAPSGVLVVGAALVLRDVVHQKLGAGASVLAIVLGGALSAVFAAPALLLASVTAFLLAELADLAVYAPLRKRNLGLAVLASGVVGAVIDSAIFLLLAFGSLDHIDGQVIGKLWMSAIAWVVMTAHARCWLGHAWTYNGPDLPYIGIVGRCTRCGTDQHISNPML